MDPTIKAIAFNQDFSCLSVGTANDYKVYNCDPFGECFHKSDDGGASIVEMLFSTSLMAVVGLGDKPSTSTRRLKIINTKRKTIICDLTFPTSVLAVKLNRKRLVVVLYDQIYIYDVSCMKLLHTIETAPTKHATVALSSCDESLLCYPSPNLSAVTNMDPMSSSQNSLDHSAASANLRHNDSQAILNKHIETGSILLFDALNTQPINIIQAHKSSIAAITISRDGKLVATASSKGTIIRVFSTSTGKTLFEFRRGTYGTSIHSLYFSQDSALLCCSSSTGTVHIFKLTADAAASTANSARTASVSTIERSTTPSATETREESVIPHEVYNGEDEEEVNEELEAILKIDKTRSQGGKRSSSISDYLWSRSSYLAKNVKGQLNNYLPSRVHSMLDPKRDFAYIKLPHSIPYPSGPQDTGKQSPEPGAQAEANQDRQSGSMNQSNISTIVGINGNNNNVMCADNYGNFYVYSIPMAKGGECILLKQFSFGD